MVDDALKTVFFDETMMATGNQVGKLPEELLEFFAVLSVWILPFSIGLCNLNKKKINSPFLPSFRKNTAHQIFSDFTSLNMKIP